MSEENISMIYVGRRVDTKGKMALAFISDEQAKAEKISDARLMVWPITKTNRHMPWAIGYRYTGKGEHNEEGIPNRAWFATFERGDCVLDREQRLQMEVAQATVTHAKQKEAADKLIAARSDLKALIEPLREVAKTLDWPKRSALAHWVADELLRNRS